MTSHTSESPELLDLIGAHCHGVATRAQSDRLEALLRADADARLTYLRHMRTHADLRTLAAASAAPAASAPDAAPLSVGRNRARRIVIVAAALLIGAVGVAVVVALLSGASHEPADDPSGPIARTVLGTVLDSEGTLWIDSRAIAAGQEITTGSVTLDGGAAEFLGRNGVHVQMRGPTTLTLHGPMSASVRRGAVAFSCPPGAVGYTVHLPGGEALVDLGTAFAVEVTDDGWSAAVTEGVVRADLTDGVAHRLPAGVRITRRRGVTTFDVPLTNASFESPAIDPAAEWGHKTQPGPLPGWTESSAATPPAQFDSDDVTSTLLPWPVKGPAKIGPAATDGRQAALLVLRSAAHPRGPVNRTWLRQRLFTVTADHVGMTLRLEADVAARSDFPAADGARAVASILAAPVDGPEPMEPVGDGIPAAAHSAVRRVDGFTPLTETATVTADLIGRTLYIELALENDAPRSNSDQYFVDHVRVGVGYPADAAHPDSDP